MPGNGHLHGERTPTERPESARSIAYRWDVPSKRTQSSSHFVAALLAAALALLLIGCGGSDGDTGTDESADEVDADGETTDTDDTDDAEPVATEEPDATPTDVVIATSTPLPTATPLPTSTPEPLEAPTPSTVLLTTAFTNSSQVTTVGIDEVFFGMTPGEAAEAASTEWVEIPSGNGQCYRVTPANGPDRVTLWVVDGFMERLDIEHPDIRTRSKLGVGNTLAELRSQLGDRLTVETSGSGGQIATFTPSDEGDAQFRLVFELEDDAVVRYRSGRVGIIDRAEASC